MQGGKIETTTNYSPMILHGGIGLTVAIVGISISSSYKKHIKKAVSIYDSQFSYSQRSGIKMYFGFNNYGFAIKARF